ncbi:MAG: polysaccharide biosynthesis protein [Planctomycetes bacterium]|nr:polysaccharide biosynthesis protein [Planctomycetota bacterium]
MPDSVRNDQNKLTWLEAFLLRRRLTINILLHSFLFAVALLLAFLVRFDYGVPGLGKTASWFSNQFLPSLPYFVLFKLVIFGRLRLFRGGWQYSSIRDVSNILLAAWIFVLVSFTVSTLTVWVPERMTYLSVPVIGPYFKLFPTSILVLDFLATVFLVCTARLGFRIYREELRPVSSQGVQRVLIVGAGNAAESIIREILRMRVERYRVVGLVDDDPNKKGMIIHGVPVLGSTTDIRQICEKLKIDEIIVAVPSATQKQMRHIIELCSGTKLKFQSLPGVGDLIDGRVTVSQIRPVDINDLLGRAAVQLDSDIVAAFLKDRRVLVTGAGGSIGSEMCRQICRFEPALLVLVEQAETPLFDIENELRASFPDIPIVPCVCDIYDRDRVMKVWDNHRPDVVIHAAAHKHVPMMERNPSEAVKNNILGTRNVADASCKFACSEFVTISTDKAVNPSSIMGACKRVGEIYTQSLNGRPGCRTQFKAVRFGNVLGSAGSVVPTFRRQIAMGGPITVTHPEMTRYFMTIPEAAQLVLQAAAAGSGGQIFLLDMGEPVKIVDLARQMITLSGFRPGEDIDIVFSGVRPGEKLFEELRTAGEDIEPTMHPKVLVWKCQPVNWDRVSATFDEFVTLRNCDDRDRVIAALRRLVPEFVPPDYATQLAAENAENGMVVGQEAGN